MLPKICTMSKIFLEIEDSISYKNVSGPKVNHTLKGMIYLRKNSEMVGSRLPEVFPNWRTNDGTVQAVSRVSWTNDSLKISRSSSMNILFNYK